MKKIHDFLIDNAVSVALCMFVVVLAFYLYHFHTQVISEDVTKWGVFGDFIGGTLNPFLSFLALVILLRTFAMQKTELDLQREELKDTKELLRLQTQTQIKQRFESTFFALLNVHNQILRDLPDNSLANTHHHVLNSKASLIKAQERLKLDQFSFCHYFRILYQLLSFVDKSQNEDKKLYSNMIRALLTDKVLRLLLIYCCGEDDEQKHYKSLIERYAIFENASFKKDLGVEGEKIIVLAGVEISAIYEAKNLYDPKAFGL